MTDAELDALEDLIARAHFATYNGSIYPETESLYLAVREKGPRLIAELRESRDRIAELERERDSLSLLRFTRSLQRDEAEARVAKLEAAIERVRAWAASDADGDKGYLNAQDDALAALSTPPEATEMEAQQQS